MVRIVIFLVASVALVYVTTTKLATLPLPDINPDSKVYFFDNLTESLKLLATKDPEEKINKLLEYSDEKLEEIKYVIGVDGEDNGLLLEKVLPRHEKYVEEALEQIEKMKEEDGGAGENEDESEDDKKEISTSGSSSLESKITDRVLEKKEILNDIHSNASEEEKPAIEEEIKKTEVIIKKIIEQVEGPVREIIIYKTENTDEAIEDKKEEEETQQEQDKKELLSETEKLYYIWIDSFYAKTLPNENEPFFVRAHVRRRDNECKFFSGKIVLKINDSEWESAISQMQPSDDLWRDLGPIELPAGTYTVEARLIDNIGRVISNKEFEMLID